MTEEYEGNRRPESAAGELLAGMLREVGFELATAVRNADIILFAIARGHREEKVRSALALLANDIEIHGNELEYWSNTEETKEDNCAFITINRLPEQL